MVELFAVFEADEQLFLPDEFYHLCVYGMIIYYLE